jgi:hypothetical protein
MARLERDDSKATKADLDALIELEEKLESKLPPGGYGYMSFEGPVHKRS